MKVQLGAEYVAFRKSLDSAPSVAVLINGRKPYSVPAIDHKVPWNLEGQYLERRPNFVMDPGYHAGCYYSQEPSSMLVGAVVKRLDLAASPLCLDLCAAPGGKTLNILSAVDHPGLVIANEVIKSRARILRENLTKWGQSNVVSSSAHPSDWAAVGPMFDLILVDAPCSGEGMFRKEPNALKEWSVDNVTFCANRQGAILREAKKCVAPGGFLIYSTCTYNAEENMSQVEQLIQAGLIEHSLELPAEWGLTRLSTNAWQAYPHKMKGEGLFLSIFRAAGESQATWRPRNTVSADAADKLPTWIKLPHQFGVFVNQQSYVARNRAWNEALSHIESKGIHLEQDIALGEIKGKDFVPSHELVMMNMLSETEQIELSLQEAVQYLRRETFTLNPSRVDGWYVACYEGAQLGWIKIAGGRMKNHYPKTWMIRKRF